MIIIINALLVGLSLSVDAFVLALSYGIHKISLKKMFITSLVVGCFHFFMPLIGTFIGEKLFSFTIIKPNIIMFLIFMVLSIDMFVHFFNKDEQLKDLSLLGIIIFAYSVSFDSLSIGIGLNYLFDSVLMPISCFTVVSFTFTLLGFSFGNVLSQKLGRYSFLFGSVCFFLYSFYVLTN